MPQSADDFRHNESSEELTLRLGRRYVELCDCACDRGFGQTLEVAYVALGLSADKRGVGCVRLYVVGYQD